MTYRKRKFFGAGCEFCFEECPINKGFPVVLLNKKAYFTTNLRQKDGKIVLNQNLPVFADRFFVNNKG